MYVGLAAGLGHNCAVRDDRSLWCWGHYECWQTGSREHPLAPRRVDDRCWHRADGGIRHSCGIDEAGSLFCFGGNSDGQLGLGFVDGGETDTIDGCNAFDVPQRVMPERSWRTVAAGSLHTCALTTEGALYCWGFNQQGQVEDSEASVVPEPVRVGGESDWAEICAGFFHTCAANSAGEIYCVGSNEHGQQGTGTWNAALTRVEF